MACEVPELQVKAQISLAGNRPLKRKPHQIRKECISLLSSKAFWLLPYKKVYL